MGEGTNVMSEIITAITGMATTVQTNGLDAIEAIVPVMATLVAAGVVVSIGVRWVRRLAS